MSKIVRKRSGNFTVINNAIFSDERLSVEALGVLAWLLSKPDNWCIIQAHIASTFKIGKEKTYRILSELIQCGYLTKTVIREKSGEYSGITYMIYDVPISEVEQPFPEKPDAVEPIPVNPPLVKTNSKQELISSIKASDEADKTRGSRVPENFTPDESCYRVASEQGLALQTQIDAFMDYWRAVPGAKGRKLDWQGTFRNWLRNSKNFNRGASNAGHSKQPSRSLIDAFLND